MALELYGTPISFEDYERGKGGCCELPDLEPDTLYTFRTNESKYLGQAAELGGFATDVVVRMIGASNTGDLREVAFEPFDTSTLQAGSIEVKPADPSGLVYKNTGDIQFHADSGYFLPADDTLFVEESAIKVGVPVQLRKRQTDAMSEAQLDERQL